MRYTPILQSLVALAAAHGTIRSITGANGVTMPGLSIQDGTPRDCSSNRCGSQADTSIIRTREITSGKASPLGRTQGAGPVDAAAAVAVFMGTGSTSNSSSSSSAQTAQDAADGTNARLKRQTEASETIVADTAGKGAASGLPTASDQGLITMTFYQVNQDGAGPVSAAIDPTSGGTDASAFEKAEVVEDVPGIFSLSGATNREIPIQVQMPAGMTCSGTVAGVSNVCVVKVQNGAIAGPFGGSAAFTQTATAKKRALAFKEKTRRSIWKA